MENLVLIGMPGSGKSTVGKLLADKTGREFVDADAVIVKEAGITIPEIFSKFGEDGFRKLETAVLSNLGKRSGLVIATGGGCVTRPENYPLLHQNSRIIWLQRNLADLPSAGRPLSKGTSMEAMYQIRKPLYEAFADCIADNNRDPETTVHTILKMEELL
jgi:shikimate dehydrogenase